MTAQGQIKSAGHVVRRVARGWRHHPGVRSGDQLTRGERAADTMRNGMGSWAFVFGSITFLVFWMALNAILLSGTGRTFDKYPFILLNLVLSCVAALQGAILLIAAKRSDQISSELALHDFEADSQSREMLSELTEAVAKLTASQAEQSRVLAELAARLAAD